MLMLFQVHQSCRDVQYNEQEFPSRVSHLYVYYEDAKDKQRWHYKLVMCVCVRSYTCSDYVSVFVCTYICTYVRMYVCIYYG